MRILLTGAGGFVGRHLAGHLEAAGHELIRTTRREGAGADGFRLISFAGEVRSAQLFDGVDAVIHAGGATPTNVVRSVDSRKINAFRSSQEFSRRLADAVSDSQVKTLIHLSSIAAMGNFRTLSEGMVVESKKAAPESEYGRGKLADEIVFASLAHSGRLVVSLRPPLVYGPGARGSWQQLVSLARSSLPLPFAAVANRRSFLSICNLCDLVEAILRQSGKGESSGSYLASDRELVSLAEVCTALRRALGRIPKLVPFPVSLMAALFRMIGREEMAAGLFGDLVVDASKVEKTFSWSPSETTLDAMAKSLAEV